jgi:IclR family acetate operon transcriptional repressor
VIKHCWTQNGMIAPTNSLERALKLLDTVAHSHDGYSNSELSRKLGIPSSSCCYVLARLTRERYLSRGADGRYTIGLKTLILSHAALRRMGFQPFAEPILYRLVEQTHLTANIGVLEDGKVLLVDRAENPEYMSASVQVPKEMRDIGIDLPAHTTGLGKALLAGLGELELQRIVDEHGLAKMTARTITSIAQLRAELQMVREHGYATVRDEHYPGFWSIAAPVFDVDGKTRAAVSLTGGSDRSAWRDIDFLVEHLLEAARQISRNMRFRDVEMANGQRTAGTLSSARLRT